MEIFDFVACVFVLRWPCVVDRMLKSKNSLVCVCFMLVYSLSWHWNTPRNIYVCALVCGVYTRCGFVSLSVRCLFDWSVYASLRVCLFWCWNTQEADLSVLCVHSWFISFRPLREIPLKKKEKKKDKVLFCTAVKQMLISQTLPNPKRNHQFARAVCILCLFPVKFDPFFFFLPETHHLTSQTMPQ